MKALTFFPPDTEILPRKISELLLLLLIDFAEPLEVQRSVNVVFKTPLLISYYSGRVATHSASG